MWKQLFENEMWYDFNLIFVFPLKYNRINSHYLSIVFCFRNRFAHIWDIVRNFCCCFFLWWCLNEWSDTTDREQLWQKHIHFNSTKRTNNRNRTKFCKMQLNRQNWWMVWCVTSNLILTFHVCVDPIDFVAIYLWLFISFSKPIRIYRYMCVSVFIESKAYQFMMLVCNNLIWYAGLGEKCTRQRYQVISCNKL